VLIALVVTPILGVILAAWRVRHAVHQLQEETEEAYSRPRQVWPRFLTFSGISYVMGLTTWVYDLPSLSLVVAAYLSTPDVAALGVASNFVRSFLTYLVVPLSGINVPLFSHLHARQAKEGVQEAFSVLTQFLLLLLVPTGCGLALLAPSLMPLLYSKFPPETVSLVLVFLLAMFLESIIGTVQPMLLVHERYGVILAARCSALVVVPLLFLLVPRYGLVGAAVAAGAARLLSRGITLIYGLRYFPLKFPLRFAGRVVAGAAVMSGVLYPLSRWWGIAQVAAGWGGKLATLGKDVALALFGAVIFWAVLKALGGLEPEGRKRLEELHFPLKKILLRLL
jgi:O-antigen/teichoic acid export membrane protein